MKAGSLVIFTLASQSAVGAYCILAALQLGFQTADRGRVNFLERTTLAAIGLLVALSLVTSLFHLGTPRKAYRALSNLRSSWLSREIWSITLFASLVLLQTTLACLWDSIQIPDVVLFLTSLVGIVLVFSMSRAYMLRTIPAWNSPVTLLSFLATSFLLGGLFVLALLSVQASLVSAFNEFEYVHAVFEVLVFGMLTDIALGLWRARLARRPREYGEIHLQGYARLGRRIMHCCLLILSVALAYWVLFMAAPGTNSAQAFWLLVAFGLALVAEMVNRFLFYRVGLGDFSRTTCSRTTTVPGMPMW